MALAMTQADQCAAAPPRARPAGTCSSRPGVIFERAINHNAPRITAHTANISVGPPNWKSRPPIKGAKALAPLNSAALTPNVPPISFGSIRFVIKLLIVGCSTPPPIEVGIIATRIQINPSQLLFESSGKGTVTSPVALGLEWPAAPPDEPCCA